MLNSKFGAILALVFFALFSTSVLAENCVPMAKKGEIPNPSVLADNIETSLQADPSGNGLVEGANITPNGFMKAIVGARGTVEDVSFLPTYLRSLYSAPMPVGETIYSRVCANDAGIPEVDITEGFPRPAVPGEVGWYDANSNYLILAGNCSNSPLNPLQRVEPEQVAFARPTQRLYQSPYPKGPLCNGNPVSRFFTMAMYEPSAAMQECSLQRMLPPGGRMTGSYQGVRATGPGNEEAFSNMCGLGLHQQEQEGSLALSVLTYSIEVTVWFPEEGVEELIFKGTLTGDVMDPVNEAYAQVLTKDRRSIMIPEVYQTGELLVHYLDGYAKDGEFIPAPPPGTPAPSGVAYKIEDINKSFEAKRERFESGEDVSPCHEFRYTGIDDPRVLANQEVALVQ